MKAKLRTCKPTRLNLSALRRDCIPHAPALSELDSLMAASSGPAISRRQMLGLTGAAVTAMAPTLKAFGASLGTFELLGDRRKLSFMLGGKERWIIDARRFGGMPEISVEKKSRSIRVTLANARFPGTDLPADFTCDIRPGLFGRKMTLRFTLGGFRATVPLESWLAGVEPARSIVDHNGSICDLGARSALKLSGTTRAEFYPNWTFRLEGSAASISGLGPDITADALLLSLLDPSEPSLMMQPQAKRTLVTLERGKQEWPLEPRIGADDGWSFRASGSPFDAIQIEAGKSRSGYRRSALVAESRSDESRLAVRPMEAMIGSFGGPFQLPLRDLRWAMSFDPAGERSALIARYGRDPEWLHMQGCSVLLGDNSDQRQFEMTSRDGRIERVDCSPALLSTCVHAIGNGVIAEPTKAPEGARLDFITSRRYEQPDTNNIRIDRQLNQFRLALDNVRTSFVRKEDLCVVTFEFINMRLEAAGGKTSVVMNGSGNGYIVLGFQPQNIAEEAFFEKADGYPVSRPSGAPADPDAGKSGDDGLKDPPVDSRIAGPSRLVFTVPAGTSAITYSLEDLLAKCSELELSVAPTALPPGHPIGRTYIKDAASFNLQNFNKAALYQTNVISATKAVVTAKGGTASKGTGVQDMILEARGRSWTKLSTVGRSLSSKEDLAISEAVSSRYAGWLAAKPKLAPPTASQTAIEAPFRLIISPNVYGAWAHSSKPVESAKTHLVELWHTRLAVRKNNKVDETDAFANLRTIRAIWTRDKDFNKDDAAGGPGHVNVPFRMSLDSTDRHNLVHLTSNYYLVAPAHDGKPRQEIAEPVEVERLMLTSLGAWMNVRGAWTPYPGSGLSVEEWRHRATTGRDNYVRVVYKGYLFPFGHRASLVKITERKFHPNKPGNTAYLRQRMFIIVREPEKAFVETGIVQDDKQWDLQMPFSHVRIKTLVTPNLDPPEESDLPEGAGGKSLSLFWPRVLNEDFLFHMVAEDFGGNDVEFTAPLLFVSSDQNIAYDAGFTTTAKSNYDSGPESRRKRPISGKRLQFAATTKPGDTAYETKSMTFTAEIPNDANFKKLPYDSPRFYPAVRRAELVIPAIKQLVGNDTSKEIEYTPTYLKDGFIGGNKGEVFGQFVGGKIDLAFEGKGDRSGGLVKPNMAISGLSRLMGPVAGDAGVANITAGSFKPDDFFGSLGAKIFGVIDLWDIIQAVGLDEGLDLVPKFITEAFTAVESFLQDLQRFQDALNQVKGLPGVASDLATTMNDVVGDITKIITVDIAAIVGGLPSAPTPSMKSNLTSDLGTLNTRLGTLSGKLPKLPTNVGNDQRKLIENFLSALQKDLASATDFVNKLFDALQLPEEVKVRFEWKPKLQSWPSSKPIFVTNNGGKPASFMIAAEAKAKTNFQSAPSFDIVCSLQNFTIDLIAPLASFILIKFNRIEFFASAGKKADLNVDMAGIEFVGALSFIETLKSLIPLDGFSDPPGIDVTEKGITASFTLALPNIAFGVFSLQNLSLSAGFNIPFIGDPLTVWFAFCKRESPFLLTVSLFGGGGFFGITLDPKGIHILEASFEFGANVSLDFGVASGGVHVMAGIYFKMEGDNCTLTGYLRIGGEVEVLGIISVSIELNMSLTYESATGKCVGKATLTIEVEVLFFSASVEISCERKFAGSNGDPTFRQLMEPYYDDYLLATVNPWKEYCEAFA
jgi:hypothetical protein